MNKRILGVALLVGGVILLAMGLDADDSLASEVSKAVNDAPSDKAVWMTVGGSILAVAGLGLGIFGGKSA